MKKNFFETQLLARRRLEFRKGHHIGRNGKIRGRENSVEKEKIYKQVIYKIIIFYMTDDLAIINCFQTRIPI